MSINFPGSNNVSDTFAHRAAVEAILGLTLRGEKPTKENVKAWLDVAINPDIPTREIVGRAMYFAARMLHGPLQPDGSAE